MLLLDTGDALIGGGLLGDATQGKVIVDGMNLMAYDAMALGPKELSLGADVLQQRMMEAGFPMLSANAVLSGTEDLLAPPYVILHAGDYRIGVIGLTRMPDEALSAFEILDPLEAAARYVPEVAGQADIVVILTNERYRPAIALAEKVPGIDLVVSALPNQLPAGVVRAPGTGTMVVTAEQPLPKHSGRRVGRLVLEVGPDGAVHDVSWASWSLDKLLPDDIEMQLLLDRYR